MTGARLFLPYILCHNYSKTHKYLSLLHIDGFVISVRTYGYLETSSTIVANCESPKIETEIMAILLKAAKSIYHEEK